MTDNERELEEWLEGRPEDVKRIARLVPPWNLYKLKETGQFAEIVAYSEDGTIRATCWYDHFPLAHSVFGLDPDSFELVPETTGDVGEGGE